MGVREASGQALGKPDRLPLSRSRRALSGLQCDQRSRCAADAVGLQDRGRTRTVGGIDLVKALLRPDRTAERQEARHAQDAATYITSLPKKQSDLPEWQAAIESLMLCSRGGDPMLARIGVMKALHRDVVPIAKKRIGASGSGINNSPLKAMRQNIAFLDATLPINVSDKK
jgi:hypothetical protein